MGSEPNTIIGRESKVEKPQRRRGDGGDVKLPSPFTLEFSSNFYYCNTRLRFYTINIIIILNFT